ncbi:EAL domain-containing protein [Escherichia coli]
MYCITKIIRAYENDEFKSYIQPIIKARNREIYGGELLMRWSTPDKKIVSPGDFINHLETAGLLPSLTRRMMWYTVNELLNKICLHNYNFHLAVNITPEILNDSNFINSCLDLIFMDGIKLILEFTEQQPFRINKSIERTLVRLTDAGAEFALDDFGVGCSVLAYIKYFPVKYIKIDKIFTGDCLHNSTSVYIIESIIELAIKMNIRTVVEGVQTQEQAYFLENLGADYLQGYYFGRPQRIIDFCKQKGLNDPML